MLLITGLWLLEQPLQHFRTFLGAVPVTSFFESRSNSIAREPMPFCSIGLNQSCVDVMVVLFCPVNFQQVSINLKRIWLTQVYVYFGHFEDVDESSICPSFTYTIHIDISLFAQAKLLHYIFYCGLDVEPSIVSSEFVMVRNNKRTLVCFNLHELDTVSVIIIVLHRPILGSIFQTNTFKPSTNKIVQVVICTHVPCRWRSTKLSRTHCLLVLHGTSLSKDNRLRKLTCTTNP